MLATGGDCANDTGRLGNGIGPAIGSEGSSAVGLAGITEDSAVEFPALDRNRRSARRPARAAPTVGALKRARTH